MKHFKLVPAAAFLAVALLGASAANGAPYFADPNPASLGSVSVSADRVSVGGTVTVSYDVTDPDGVASVSPEVIDCDPATAGADSAPTGYQSSADTAKSFGITYDSTSRPGRRWLAALTVRDRAGYVTTFYDESYARAKGLTGVPTADFSKVTWVVDEAGADPNPASLGSVSVSADRVSVGGTVTVSYDVTDPDGVASVSPEVIDCDPATAGADSAPTGYQSSADTAKSFGITYDSTSRPGRRWLAALTVRDRAGYVTTFYDESYARAKGLTGVPTADFSKVTWEIVSPDQAPVYKELDTASHVYFRGSGTGLRFRFDGPFEQFSYLAVDGAAVDPSNYSVKSGSTVIELSPAYLAALPTGSHDLKVLYRDGGTATTSFAISGKPESSSEQDAGKGNVKPSERVSVLENGPALARTGDCTGFTIVSMLIAAAALLAASALLKRHFGA